MNRDDVSRMAREAGFASADFWPDDFQGLFGCVERFAALVAAAEREACAKVCEMEAAASVLGHGRKAVWQAQVAGRCATAIRARGQA